MKDSEGLKALNGSDPKKLKDDVGNPIINLVAPRGLKATSIR